MSGFCVPGPRVTVSQVSGSWVPGLKASGLRVSGSQGIPGSGSQGIPGSGSQGVPGSGSQGPGSQVSGPDFRLCLQKVACLTLHSFHFCLKNDRSP